jgi:hypothetical protein
LHGSGWIRRQVEVCVGVGFVVDNTGGISAKFSTLVENFQPG